MAPLAGLKSIWSVDYGSTDRRQPAWLALANLSPGSRQSSLPLTLGHAALTDAGLAWITSLKELVNLDLRACQDYRRPAWAEVLFLRAAAKLEYLYSGDRDECRAKKGSPGTLGKHKEIRLARSTRRKSRVTPAGVVAADDPPAGAEAIHYP